MVNSSFLGKYLPQRGVFRVRWNKKARRAELQAGQAVRQRELKSQYFLRESEEMQCCKFWNPLSC
jgi:hypothetical protein